MKSFHSLTILLLLGIACLFSSSSCEKRDSASLASLEQGFKEIPDSVRLAAYWYWISDNISKEGVVRDLEAMKEQGITRAFIGNIGIEDLEYGEVKILTPEWWDILHTALKKATELDIEMGIFNSPGWSQSGGPWVKPEESMRYLASSDLTVKGPISFKSKLAVVGKDAQDVRVLAYPTKNVSFEKTWKAKQGQDVNMSLGKEQTIRTVSVRMNKAIRAVGELYVKNGSEYTLLKKFNIDRWNTALNVGFDPLAPIVIALPETTASDFRFVIKGKTDAELEVTLSSQPMIERYPEKTLAKMFPEPLPLWHDYQWEKQPEVTDPSLSIQQKEVIDITANLSADGTLTWDVPEGEWTITRYAMMTTGVTNSPATPEATGLEVDKMSKKHVATHFDAFIGEILKRVPAEDRKTFKVVVQDSYETGGQNWTDDMIEKFQSVYGYDPIPYLPVLQGKVVGNRDMSDRFLWDLRRLIADRVAYDYVAGLREVSHQHGLTTWLENYGHWGFPGEFLQYGGQSDEIGGEFWSEGSLGDIENRAASSCGHTYGKRKIWAESFTSGGPNFGRYPATMKQRGDRFFTEGINATLLHLYIQQPYEDKEPGMSAWFGNDFQRKNVWFSQMNNFSDYLRRANFMLQQGTYVADVAYFIGEDAPKMTGVCDPELPSGYSFDYINAEILMNAASVDNGCLSLASGMKYRVLVLPKLETMRPELLKKITDLVNEGLVILGPAPSRSPSLANYPQSDNEIQEMAQTLWGDNNNVITFGKGKVYPDGTSLQEVFDQLNILPDCDIKSKEAPVLFIHRTMKEGDFYFISNQSNKKISFDADFRVTGAQPELWNPLTTEIRLLPEYTQNNQVTSLPIELDAFESSFVVFRKGNSPKKLSGKNFPTKEVLKTIDTPWTVAFEAGKRGPESPVTFNQLEDWTTSSDERIKYFSGEVVYTTTFTLDQIPDKDTYVDLGQVMVMAKVKLNDQYVGGVWTTPYRLPITEYLKAGENKLEVTVVNNWQNRLIGDENLPKDQRHTWTPVNPWRADSPLQSSGLLGPVEIQAYSYAWGK